MSNCGKVTSLQLGKRWATCPAWHLQSSSALNVCILYRLDLKSNLWDMNVSKGKPACWLFVYSLSLVTLTCFLFRCRQRHSWSSRLRYYNRSYRCPPAERLVRPLHSRCAHDDTGKQRDFHQHHSGQNLQVHRQLLNESAERQQPDIWLFHRL